MYIITHVHNAHTCRNIYCTCTIAAYKIACILASLMDWNSYSLLSMFPRKENSVIIDRISYVLYRCTRV